MQEFWGLAAIVLVAGLIQGTTGFGFGLFAVGVFSLLMDVSRAAAISSMVGLSSIVMNIWTTRGDIDWREAAPLLVTGVPATAIGVYLLQSLPIGSLRLAIAIMILAGCAVTIWAPAQATISKAWPWAYLAGIVSGLFGGAVNMGGPPLVFYTLLRDWDKALCKSTFSIVFLAASLTRIPLYVVAGNLTLEVFLLGLLLIIPALIGTLLGTRVFHRMSTVAFRYAATGVLVALALRVLVT